MKGIGVRRLTFLTGLSSVLEGMLSEYLGFVLRRGWEDTAGAALARACFGWRGWSEAALDLMPAGSASRAALESCASSRRAIHDPPSGSMASYQIATTEGRLETYKQALSPSARKRLFHLRKRLVRGHGEPVLEHAASNQIAAFIDELNALHALRWGRPAFAGPRLDFILRLCREKAQSRELALGRLAIGGTTRSVLLNLRAGRTEYNLQAGFDAGFDRKIPLGYLHLGYAIEEAFRNPDVDKLDLLAGDGKNTNYKAALATHQTALETLRIARHPLFRLAYALRRLNRPK